MEGMESLAPVLADRMITLLDLLPAGTPVVNVGPERIEARAVDLARTSEEFLRAGWHNAAVEMRFRWTCPRPLTAAPNSCARYERQLPVSGLGTLGAVAAASSQPRHTAVMSALWPPIAARRSRLGYRW